MTAAIPAPLPSALDETSLRVVAQRLPKVVLHDHLDGGLREASLLNLLHQQGIRPPADDVERLSTWFDERAHAGSLEQYLRGFALTVGAMAHPTALCRVAREAAEDVRQDGAVLAEFRIAPLLFEPFGLAGEAVIESLVEGLRADPLPSGLIVCAMRHMGEDHVARSADLALRWQGRGVVGFDLAGPERGWPATEHAQVLRRVTDQGLGLTLHAGEADTAERVIEAVQLGARRIGHGVRLADWIGSPGWPAALDLLREHAVHLEVCPSSNVHTGAAVSIAEHPIRALWDAGVSVSFHSDNRLMSRTSASGEAAALVGQAGFRWEELLSMGRAAARASFLAPADREQALRFLEKSLAVS